MITFQVSSGWKIQENNCTNVRKTNVSLNVILCRPALGKPQKSYFLLARPKSPYPPPPNCRGHIFFEWPGLYPPSPLLLSGPLKKGFFCGFPYDINIRNTCSQQLNWDNIDCNSI